MKKLLLLALLAVGMTAHAETIVTNDMDAETNNGGITFDDDSNWSMHFYVGVDIPTGAPEGVDFAPFRSWDIDWTVFQYDFTPEKWKTTFSVGAGINWRNYTLSGHDKLFYKGEDDVVRIIEREGKWSELSSRIHTLGISFPVLIKQSFTKDLALSLGVQVNWNVLCRLNNYYEVEDEEVSYMTKRIGERPLTVDLMGILHISKVGVYCKYSPMSVLKTDRGPEFKSISLGVYF